MSEQERERIVNSIEWATDAGHRFVSNMRVEDARALLAEVERLRAENSRLVAQIDEDHWDDWGATPCEVCGAGCLYGSRHPRCGALVLEVERLRAALVAESQAHAEERGRLRSALHSISRDLAQFRGGDPSRTSELALKILTTVDAALEATLNAE